MSGADLARELERRSPGNWELYRKRSDSREVFTSAGGRREAVRSEEGWSARWWKEGAPRFAAASAAADLAAALAQSERVAPAPAAPPRWPASKSPRHDDPAAAAQAPEMFEALGRLVAAESRGQAFLADLAVRAGSRTERLWNSAGADVSMRADAVEGVARAVGRQDGRACEARAVFLWEGEPALDALARRLSDRATLPLSERAAPLARGEWLLDPSVGAALLAAVAPLFTAAAMPPWVQRGQLFSTRVTLVDDASADAAFDGEATPTRRVVLVDEGTLRARLHDLSSAAAAGTESTGHGVRPSYRTPPAPRPRRLFFETTRGESPRDLLLAVRRGLFASALTAPVRVDVERDRFEVEFTGVSIVAGRAQGPVAGARAKGRLSQLFRRISGVSTDRQFFPCPYPTGAPTLLVERAEFD
jgi:predicted Zn-dependent protease